MIIRQGVDYVTYEERKELEMLRALACGFLCEFYGKPVFYDIDWEDQGTTIKKIDDWWAEYRIKYLARKEQENLEAERRLKKEAALAKLTDEEKILLGLKP